MQGPSRVVPPPLGRRPADSCFKRRHAGADPVSLGSDSNMVTGVSTDPVSLVSGVSTDPVLLVTGVSTDPISLVNGVSTDPDSLFTSNNITPFC